MVEKPAQAEVCGDGTCSAGEVCSCAQDCGLQVWCPQVIRTMLWALILLLMICVAFFLTAKKKDKEPYTHNKKE